MFEVIKNANCAPRKEAIEKLLQKYFSNPDWEYKYADYEKTYADKFFVMNVIKEGEALTGYISLSITGKSCVEGLSSGRLKEHEVEFYPEAGGQEAYLFFMTLLVENRRLTPYLVKSAFGEVAKILREWKINVKYVYTMAYTKVSERLMRRHGMQQIGVYEGHYPIMAIKVTDNPYLRAFIPNVSEETKKPW